MPAFCCLLACSAALHSAQAQQVSATAGNVILVTMDGLRWQEVFRGVDERLLVKEDNSFGSSLADKFSAEQIAATLLALPGIDYRRYNPVAGAPLSNILVKP
jgi:hypothetical protein